MRRPTDTLTVPLLDEKTRTSVATASGGINSLIRRFQAGIRRDPTSPSGYTITATWADIQRIPSYWKNTGGKPGSGGYQRMLPLKSFAAYLPTIAPLFEDV